MSLDLVRQQKILAHSLIDHLNPEKLQAAVGLLESMLDPFDRALAAAATDDEPVTEQESRDIQATREWFKHNPGIPLEQVVAELGLSMEDVSNYEEPT